MADSPTKPAWQPKPVVDSKEALKAGPEETPKPVKRFTFTKNMNPDEPVVLPGKGPLKFHRAVRPDHTKATFSTFDTKDADLARALREFAAASPHLYVFETNQ